MASMTYLVTCRCPGSLGVARVEDMHPTEPLKVFFGTRREIYWGSVRELMFAHCVRCTGCGAMFMHRAIKAAKSDHKCDSRCLASQGPNCECSCGGNNHGRAWS